MKWIVGMGMVLMGSIAHAQSSEINGGAATQQTCNGTCSNPNNTNNTQIRQQISDTRWQQVQGDNAAPVHSPFQGAEQDARQRMFNNAYQEVEERNRRINSGNPNGGNPGQN